MNIVDYVIIGIIGISVLFGLYRGFIASVLNMGCGLMSFLASFWVCLLYTSPSPRDTR